MTSLETEVIQELANYQLLLAEQESTERQIIGETAKDMLALECFLL